MPQWIRACATDDINPEDLIRFDHDGDTYAIYHAPDGRFYATAGRRPARRRRSGRRGAGRMPKVLTPRAGLWHAQRKAARNRKPCERTALAALLAARCPTHGT